MIVGIFDQILVRTTHDHEAILGPPKPLFVYVIIHGGNWLP
jgi:hypothetical protein